jgi:phosphoglycerate dehydrogenase-like enzyme
MTTRIALLGVLKGQLDNLSRHWDFPYEVVDIDVPSPDGGPHRVDVLMSAVFNAAAARKVTFRLLQSTGVGIDKIDLNAVPAAAWVCNMYGHEFPIAEYCLSAMLNAEIDWQQMTSSFASDAWSRVYFGRPRHGELGGKTLGLVGFGHIGKEVARRAAAFDMGIVAVATSARSAPEGVEWIRGPEGLPELLKHSDYVVLAAPLTEKTRGLIGAEELSQMKQEAVLINVGRGALADEEALYKALSDGRIRGAVLDSWFDYPETAEDTDVKASRYDFAALPNVRCTPHTSGWTKQLAVRRYSKAAENIRNLIAGRPLFNVVRAPSAS